MRFNILGTLLLCLTMSCNLSDPLEQESNNDPGCSLQCANGTCQQNNDGDSCDCDDGYAGSTCEDCADGFEKQGETCQPVVSEVCEDVDCDDPGEVPGTCDGSTGTPVCDCQPGFEGDPCEAIVVQPMCDETCDNGTCNNDVCNCERGYGGDNCDVCATGFTGANCDACADDFYGEDCEISCESAGAADWGNTDYRFRRPIILTSNLTVPEGQILYRNVPHKILVDANKALPSGNDFLAIWENPTGQFEQIARVRTHDQQWNDNSVELAFRLPGGLPNVAYEPAQVIYFYYGNPAADALPSPFNSPADIFTTDQGWFRSSQGATVLANANAPNPSLLVAQVRQIDADTIEVRAYDKSDNAAGFISIDVFDDTTGNNIFGRTYGSTLGTFSTPNQIVELIPTNLLNIRISVKLYETTGSTIIYGSREFNFGDETPVLTELFSRNTWDPAPPPVTFSPCGEQEVP